jgi:hypothetical protein
MMVMVMVMSDGDGDWDRITCLWCCFGYLKVKMLKRSTILFYCSGAW